MEYFSLADFVAPPGHRDHLGMFAVGVHGAERLAARYDAENDDYKKIMVAALADRLAEAMAEMLHRRIRVETWGYAADEALVTRDLLKVKYHILLSCYPLILSSSHPLILSSSRPLILSSSHPLIVGSLDRWII